MTRARGFLPAILGAALLLAACSNHSDPRWLEAAASLVPAKSDVTHVAENTTGLAFESGPYFVLYEITDGGLDVALETAITERALAQGWELGERSEDPDTITVRFVRDDLEALVHVWLDQDPTGASIMVGAAD